MKTLIISIKTLKNYKVLIIINKQLIKTFLDIKMLKIKTNYFRLEIEIH
jgi:hypothetical protein